MKKISLLCLLIFFLNINTAPAQEKELTDKISNSVVKLELFWGNTVMMEESNSLGVIISREGYVLTCYHCISISENTASVYGLPPGTIAETININLIIDGKKESLPAKVIAIDEWRDMAIIKPYEDIDINIKTKIKVTGSFNKEDIYYASVDPKNPWNSVSAGTLAYSNLNDNGRQVAGFSMNIKSGSSGSGLFDSHGRLIGLIYATGSLEDGMDREITLAIPGQSLSLFLSRNNVPYELE